MAYKGSTYFKGNTRKPFPGGFNAGASVTILHTHVFDKDQLDTVDFLELMPLPAGARVVDMTYSSENLPAGNGTIGILSGTPGDPDGARTMGTEYVNAVAHPAVDTKPTLILLAAVAASDANRSIGFKTSALIGVAANRKLNVRVTLQF